MKYIFFEKMTKTAGFAFRAILILLSNFVAFVLGVPILLVGVGLVSGALIIFSVIYSFTEWSSRSNQLDIEVDNSLREFTSTRHAVLVDIVKPRTQINPKKEARLYAYEPTREWQTLRQIEHS
jgi:hypothetical protein